MIVLKKLSWSEAFSYGHNNTLDLNSNKIIQLIGKNGHGKSSIALILEEVLYNKNSKGIKKADILNRNSKAKSYSIELKLEKDGDEYSIETTRGTTQTVKLSKNGVDISAHTSTATYKMIEDIIGFDHKTFTQIVYQSNTYSLEFLTATDTNRKKFLIDLLNLSIYTRASEVFKELCKDTANEVELINLKIRTIKDWLAKFNKEDLIKQEILEVPPTPTELINKAVEFREQIKNIEFTNKKITQNNKYKEILNTINLEQVSKPTTDINALKAARINILERVKDLQKIISGVATIKDTCSACGQPIDNSHKKVMAQEAKDALPGQQQELVKIDDLIVTATEENQKYLTSVQNTQEWERYHSLINFSMETELLDRAELVEELRLIEETVDKTNKEIARIESHNTKASAHNAKVDVVNAQLETMNIDLRSYSLKLADVSSKLNNLQILVKTFSTTGLVAYKIECLVKDLEAITNEYLLDLSDGRFQLSFKVNASDKLNVVINDNGKDIDILALSNGERARVNIATLLAIRKLMQTLSNSRINLLILDETIESLDGEGKDKLVELLLNEEHLNTILVSHSFTHPLIEKLSVVKTNNLSRIEYA
jgi:DNA repair exonuclease SbcCD ATPase subunit